MTNVSVVIVNYNSGRFLEFCIESVRYSDCSLEIIVVDNASTDESINFLNSFSTSDKLLRVVRNKENRGFSAAINQGVDYSKSEHVLLLNPDCLVLPHTIRLLQEALDADVSAGIVGGLVFNFDGSEQRGCRRREPTLGRSFGKVVRRHVAGAGSNQIDMTDEPLPKQKIYVDSVSGSFLMIRRTTFTDVGGMDEGFFLHFEDLDLCRRVRDIGWQVVFAPDISIFHYQGGSIEHSGHNVLLEKHRSMRRYQWKHHGRNLWVRVAVFFIVWAHFLLQRTIQKFAHEAKYLDGRKRLPTKLEGLPRIKFLTGSESGNRLLVLGVIDEYVQSIIHFGATTGWSVYACAEVEGAGQLLDVYCLHPEYLDKVPVRDAPEFNALLIAPSLSDRGLVAQVVEKFRIRRVAIIQLIVSPDRSNKDDMSKSFEPEISQEPLARELMEDKASNCETRVFSFSSSKLAREDQTKGIQWCETIQGCFSWLSK
jgi:hypothetical protein